MFRDYHGTGIPGALAKHHATHLRYHISGTPNHYLIANKQSQPLNPVHIVESCIGDRHTTDEYRLQSSDRRDRSRSAHLKINIHQAGRCLFSGVFKSDRPARFTGDVTELLLQGQLVNLDNDAINVVTKTGSSILQALNVVQTRFKPSNFLSLRVDAKTPKRKLAQYLCMGSWLPIAINPSNTVTKHRQRSACGDP